MSWDCYRRLMDCLIAWLLFCLCFGWWVVLFCILWVFGCALVACFGCLLSLGCVVIMLLWIAVFCYLLGYCLSGWLIVFDCC